MAYAAPRLLGGAGAPGEDDWPHTGRLLPWLAAAMVAMLFLVPIDSVTLPVPLPFDARPDRVLLVVAFGLWALVLAVRGPQRGRGGTHRYGGLEVAIFVFVGLAVLSVAFNGTTLAALGESAGAVKRLVLLVSYAAFYVFVVANVRASEVPAFVRLIVGLAAITAAGTIVEAATNFNVFFWTASVLSPPGSTVASGAAILAPGGRPDITGPARHGLADCTLLAMVVPLAVVGSRIGRGRAERLLFGAAGLLILVGSVATIRRSGVVLPFVASSAVIFLGGRRMLPVAGAFAAGVVIVAIAAPGAVAEVSAQFSGSNVAAQQSIGGRTSDYEAVWPDIRHRALLGRGFGTYEAGRYRFLDNQYLGLAIGMGFIGLAAFLAMVLGAAGVALRAGLRRQGLLSWVALAAFGSMLAFALANGLFDALAFPHAPYGFFTLAALAVVCRRGLQDAAGRPPPE